MRTKNVIWATMRARVKGESGDVGEVYKLSIIGRDFIKECSPEIKTIIAFYSKLYLTEENEILALALGDFTTLKEAQDTLLEGKEQYFKAIKKQDYIKGSFEIETEDDMVYANLKAMIGSYSGTGIFRIHETGEIELQES